jgi:hypothetical protein
MIYRLPLLLLATISLPFSAHFAQGAGKPGKGIHLRLLACEVTKELPKVFLETKDSKSEVFDLPSSAFTAPLPVSERAVAIKAPGNESPLSNINLPGQGNSFAVLLASQEPSGFVPTVVRLDDPSFKPGDYHFINRTEKTVVVKLGGAEVVLEAGQAVTSRPTDPVHNHHFNITMSDRGEARDKIFASTRWPTENGNRSYVIFLTGYNGKTTYRTVDQSVDVKEPVGKKKKH